MMLELVVAVAEVAMDKVIRTEPVAEVVAATGVLVVTPEDVALADVLIPTDASVALPEAATFTWFDPADGFEPAFATAEVDEGPDPLMPPVTPAAAIRFSASTWVSQLILVPGASTLGNAEGMMRILSITGNMNLPKQLRPVLQPRTCQVPPLHCA
jgi:hypothetical protein